MPCAACPYRDFCLTLPAPSKPSPIALLLQVWHTVLSWFSVVSAAATPRYSAPAAPRRLVVLRAAKGGQVVARFVARRRPLLSRRVSRWRPDLSPNSSPQISPSAPG